MKQIKEFLLKYYLLVILLPFVAYGLYQVQKDYVKLYTTEEGQFIIQDGHMYQLKLIELDLIGEE